MRACQAASAGRGHVGWLECTWADKQKGALMSQNAEGSSLLFNTSAATTKDPSDAAEIRKAEFKSDAFCYGSESGADNSK